MLALQSAFADGSWGKYDGPHCQRLQTALAEMHDTPFVSLCSSGTIAVELALRSLQVTSDDEVILAGYDFSGNFRSIEMVGARPVLVDIVPDTWCLDVDQLEEAVSERTKAVIVSHLHGGTAQMPQISALSERYGFAVIEDACQVPGARIEGRVAGSWGDVGLLSFGGSKLLTAGRGGALITRHAEVFQRSKIFSERGNRAFPLSELQAAVLAPQLSRLDERNRLRSDRVEQLRQLTQTISCLHPVSVAEPPNHSAFYKFAWLWEPPDVDQNTRGQFVAAIQAEGIAVDAGFRGFTRRSQRRCRRVGQLQHSQRAASQTLLLHHPVLLEPDEVIQSVAEGLRKVSTSLSCCASQSQS